MTTGPVSVDPYVVPDAASVDTDPSPTILDFTIVASAAVRDLGGGLMADVETYNGTIPGPTLFLTVGDTVIVRLVNELPYPTGIHWHGIELANASDGTEVTQNAAVAAFSAPPPAPQGGTFLYKFTVPRPGLFWYHPHHGQSTNRVFHGLYGMIVVTDPNEAMLHGTVLPGPADTRQVVLSDVTVCKAPGSNDPATYDPALPWVGGGALPAQPSPFPITLCEIAPGGSATDDDGNVAAASYLAGDIPSLVRTGRVNEGQTVLTNGVNVGGRAGSPSAPGVLSGTAMTMPVQSGQGLRLQIVNCATIRYFRLILTTSTGAQVPLVRIGGEGGLLDEAIVEGGMTGLFDSKYGSGEILLPPASRADVVAAIPAGAAGVLTLWTQDYDRTGAGFANIPTVPVMHFDVTGAAPSTYTIAPGDDVGLLIGPPLTPLGAPDAVPLDPSTFVPPKAGTADPDIELTTPPSINGIVGMFHGEPYTSLQHLGSSRFAEQGRTLELTVTNTSAAHHPFHLHGFSFQPISLTRPASPSYSWPFTEFRDNLDIPGQYTLTFRVRLEDRNLVDGLTPGGSLGRWFFHCHIFFHHHQGMIGELVVTAVDGSEKPDVSVGGSWAYTPAGGIATRAGHFNHPDGDPVTLNATLGAVVPTGADTWSWTVDSTGMPDQVQYVYVTANDPAGRRDQCVFRLKIGAPDDGADNGDPHVHTVDGKRYDFQSVGEFVLLRDRDGLEVQARQWPVESATPITDPHTGLRSCVSVNTALAARVGSHRISYQPLREGTLLQFFVDGKPARPPFDGIDLDDDRVSAFTAPGGGTGIRVDYSHGPVLTVTPYFWNAHNIWLLNVGIAHTQADEGVMGPILDATWLPLLPDGSSLGPMPESLHERFVTLYRTFADAWRVTDATSLFVYLPGTSTKTFTDREWPAEEPPCRLQPQFQVPGANPPSKGIPVERAKKICGDVEIEGLFADCVFDVATTGDPELARMYLAEQEVRRNAVSVRVHTDKRKTRCGEKLTITAIVLPLTRDARRPKGEVMFLADDKPLGPRVPIDKEGRASITVDTLASGDRRIRASFQSREKEGHRTTSSATTDHQVAPELTGPTLRRVLQFLNTARSAADLVRPPDRTHALIDERFEHGVHLDEPGGHGHGGGADSGHGNAAGGDAGGGADGGGHGGGHGGQGRGGGQVARPKKPGLMRPHLAKHILDDRRRSHPLYGFTRLDDVLAVTHLRPDALDDLVSVFSPAVYGQWDVLYGGEGTPAEVAHAALLYTGQVLFLPESFAATDTMLWDPQDSDAATAFRTLTGATTGLTGVLFCGAHSFLQDGKLLAVGGGTSAAGTTAAWKFDPVAETWQPTTGSMGSSRWYPTAVTLGEDVGRVLVVGGGPTTMEIYEEATDSFVPVHGPGGLADPAANHGFPQLYPGLHLLPSGAVFFTRTGNNTGTPTAAYFTFTTPTSGEWTDLAGGSAGEDRGRGMSLLLLRQHPAEPDRILVVGGGGAATQATVGLIDNPPTGAAWLTAGFPDGLARSSVNGVLLPDGTALVCGGRPTGGAPANGGTCYLYNPVGGAGIGTFSEMDESAYARQYHSVAVLLPSAKVMATGGSSNTIEVFSPPYLFNADGTPADRPVITSFPDPAGGTVILHGSTFAVGTPDAAGIAKVVLVRPMAVTHQTDAEQRVLALTWSLVSPTELSVTAPDGRIYPYAGGGGHSHVIAPRGFYLLFVISTSGVPSEGKFVRLV